VKRYHFVKESNLVLDKSRLRSHIISLIADKIAQTDDIDQLGQWLKLIVGKELSPRGTRYIIKAEDVVEAINEARKDPCWKGYKQIGMKKKGKKEVPNCVPESKEIFESVANINWDRVRTDYNYAYSLGLEVNEGRQLVEMGFGKYIGMIFDVVFHKGKHTIDDIKTPAIEFLDKLQSTLLGGPRLGNPKQLDLFPDSPPGRRQLKDLNPVQAEKIDAHLLKLEDLAEEYDKLKKKGGSAEELQKLEDTMQELLKKIDDIRTAPLPKTRPASKINKSTPPDNGDLF
jgi:hypothetical protein